jgi:uncharacterized repeat protein (TIGR01451 family)
VRLGGLLMSGIQHRRGRSGVWSILMITGLLATNALAAPVLTLGKDIASSSNGTAAPGTVPGGFEDHWVGNDAGDVLNFKLTISNTGDMPAHNVSLQDRFSQTAVSGQGYTACAIDSVQSADGLVTYTTTGNLFSSALVLVKPIPAGQQACIRYHCTVDPTTAPGDPIDNCALLKTYAAFDLGPNLATSEVDHCARATLKGIISLEKQITSSSVPATTPDSNINQGEILGYSIAVVLGEGQYDNFTLSDDQHTIGAITCGSGGFTCSGNVSIVGSRLTVAATTGTTIGTVNYVYTMQQSSSGTNTATADSDDTPAVTDAASWTRTEPSPNIVVSGVPATATGGDTVNATFTWTNTGNPMYQCTVTSTLDPAVWDTAAANVTLGANPSGWTFTYDEGTRTITGVFAPGDAPCTDGAIAVGLKIRPTAPTGNYSLSATYSGNSLPAGHLNPEAGGVFSDADSKPIAVTGLTFFIDATKTVADLNGGTVLPGDTLQYTVVLTNTGAGPVTNVVFADTLPANTLYVPSSLTTTKGTPQVSGSTTVSVDGFGLATSESVTITFQVVVAAGTPVGTLISNQGSVDSTETTPEPTDVDGNDGNGDQPTDVIVGGLTPDQGLTAQKLVQFKTDADSSSSITAGDTMTYTVVIRNAGNVPVTNVTFADVIPAGLTYAAATATVTPSVGNSVTVTGANVSAAIGSIEPIDFVTLTWDVTIDAPLINLDGNAPQEVFTNQGTIDSDQTVPKLTDADGIPGNGNQPTQFTAVAGIAGSPTVDLQKSVRLFTDRDNDGLYDPGDTAEYQLVFSNTGSANATGVIITNPIPANTTLVANSVVPSQGAVGSTNPITVNVGTVSPGNSVTITFRVTVNSGVPAGTIVSCQATASGDNFTSIPSDNDGTPGNPRDPTTFPVDNDADLALLKTASPNPVAVGGQLTYTVTVTNNGPDTAVNTVVTDNLPGGVTLVSATASQGGPCTGGATIVCDLGNLGPAGVATVTIVVTAPTVGTVTNSATVTSDTSDPDLDNNSDSEDATVATGVDLSVTKTVAPASPPVGGMLTYTLIATNNGGITATGVVVTDPLPPQVTYQSASSTVGTCSQSGGTVTCNIGTLAGNASATITIMALRNSAAAFNNVATIDGDQTDPVPGNNGGSAGTPGGAAEICGNCLDDDGDGRVDYEDSDCCTQTELALTRSTIRLRPGGAGRLQVRGLFSDPAFNGVDPRQEGITVQLRNAAGQLACCTTEAPNWRRLVRRHFGWWDSAVTLCPPVKDLEFQNRRTQRSRFELRTGHITLAEYLQQLNLTLRVGDRCASGSFTPVTER